MNKSKLSFFPLGIALICAACGTGFLDAKPDKSLTVPASLPDLQALLDNSNAVMNWSPNLGLISTDDIYITNEGYTSVDATVQNSYLWSEYPYQSEYVTDWEVPYKQIFYANVVLDALDTFTKDLLSTPEAMHVKGSALFYRALAYYEVAQLFAQPYDAANASQVLGIPLRMESDVNRKSERATLANTYEQIIKDTNTAIELLPVQTAYLTRPSKAAAYALLARIYLTMEDYASAGNYADQCLSRQDQLLDYNTLTVTVARPLPAVLRDRGNNEVLFYSVMNDNAALFSALTSVDTNLYHSYAENDLRKTAFFNKRAENIFTFKGSYTGSAAVFTGLATDEVYLIRSECRARAGDAAGALADLNRLLTSRYKTGTYVPFTVANTGDVLGLVLQERRKELVYRNLRWTDLRRLNKDHRFQISIKREINGMVAELPPNDQRYTLPLPEKVIVISGMEQNPRK